MLNILTNVKLSDLEAILATATNSEINACDRMYSADFRSEAFPLNEMEDWDEIIGGLYENLSLYIYENETKVLPPIRPEEGFDCEYEADHFYDLLDDHQNNADNHVSNKYPDISINSDVLVVEICNYKGEGEGIELYALNKNLPIFKSKCESFNQVNY
jgi:hypothetical protein